MNNKKARYPIRLWLGKFESWLCVMRNGKTMRVYDAVLENFFATFPRKRGLEEFNSVDVADYKQIRIKQGISSRSLTLEMYYLRKFWNWLVEDQRLCLPIIKNVFKTGDWRPAPGTITLAQVNALLAACDSDKDRRLIIEVMAGGKCPGKRFPSITAAANRVGLPGFSLGKLRLFILNKLARDVVKAYCDQLLDSLTPESQSAGNTLTSIERPIAKVGSPISDNGNNLSPVIGVNK